MNNSITRFALRPFTLWRALAAVALAAAAFVVSGRASSAATTAATAPCYVRYGYTGGFLFVFNGSFESCARTAQAAKSYGAQWGMGVWGGYAVAIDTVSNTYAFSGGRWQYVGVVRNVSGTVGSLSDRCSRGDAQACAQWRSQLQAAINALARLYPAGWSR